MGVPVVILEGKILLLVLPLHCASIQAITRFQPVQPSKGLSFGRHPVLSSGSTSFLCSAQPVQPQSALAVERVGRIWPSKQIRQVPFSRGLLGIPVTIRSGKMSSTNKASLGGVMSKFLHEYGNNTPKRLKIVDAYLVYVFLTGVMQFAYCCLVGTFPFNAFLSGFISCVGSFVLAVCLRLQVNPQNKSQFETISPERAFADFTFAHIILHLVVMNFIG
eukprot:maker-scaffold38_size502422-snap-gene-1.16 protein:Tk05863 transcript:maker-scaffold38_size502422-snap-gene-1.16-mRNA-1 annotation:"hypothetical protein DAPPUDRAFT_300829"